MSFIYSNKHLFKVCYVPGIKLVLEILRWKHFDHLQDAHNSDALDQVKEIQWDDVHTYRISGAIGAEQKKLLQVGKQRWWKNR